MFCVFLKKLATALYSELNDMFSSYLDNNWNLSNIRSGGFSLDSKNSYLLVPFEKWALAAFAVFIPKTPFNDGTMVGIPKYFFVA
jgi:hypothetical protein